MQDKLEVLSLRFTKEGAWLSIKMPISIIGFHLMEEARQRAGQPGFSWGGGGSSEGSDECIYTFGPFTDPKEAEDLIETLRKEVGAAVEKDRAFRARFSHLVKEWPLP